MNEERAFATEGIAEPKEIVEPRAIAEPVVEEAVAPLFPEEELAGYRARWGGIQTGFVDEPRKAVEQADALVAELTKRLTEGFAEERRKLEAHWEKAEKITTEDLRIEMRRYRSFFERLLLSA